MNTNLKKALIGVLVLILAIVACTDGPIASHANEQPKLVSIEANGYGEVGISSLEVAEIDLTQAMFVPAATIPANFTAWRVYDLISKAEIGFVTVGRVMSATNALTLIASLALGNTVQNLIEGRNLVLQVENPDGTISYWEVNQVGQIVNQTNAFALDANSVQNIAEDSQAGEERQMSKSQPNRVANVEDDPNWSKIVARVFTGVDWYPTCEALIAALTSNPSLNYEVYIVDNDLGNGNMRGPVCVGQIRALRVGARIIGFSAHDDDPGFKSAGADGWLSKITFEIKDLRNLNP